MTPESQRIAIAKACGWKDVHMPGLPGLIVGKAPEDWAKTHSATHYDIQPAGEWHEVPDFLNDLNAMNWAENVREVHSYPRRENYLYTLMDILKRDNTNRMAVCATAAQRAEAFLLALDIWQAQEGESCKGCE